MSPQIQGTPQDEQAIRNMVTQFVAAWNKNDAKGLASHFTSDGDLINPAGRIARGSTEVEKLFRDEQSGQFKNTRFRLTVTNIRFLKPDIAVTDLEYEINDMKGPLSTMKGLVSLVVRKDSSQWLINACRPMVPVPA